MPGDPRFQTHFKSSYTPEQYKNAVRAAYKLGFMDGKQKRKELFLLLQKTNHRLWEELGAIDKREPLNGITLTVRQARGLLGQLQKPTRDKKQYWAGLLKEKMEGLERSEPEVLEVVNPPAKKKETPLTKRIEENYRKNIKAMRE